jgi:lipoprotein-anchoring transpeptidase ErfK/SrfK
VTRAALLCARTALVVSAVTGVVRADSVLPPWSDPHDVPLPDWARSVAPSRDGVAIASAPGRPDARRGVVGAGARLPLFASARNAACAGRWLEVGPMAWVCSDTAEVSRDPAAPAPPARAAREDGLPWQYSFVGRDGAEAFLNLPTAESGASPDETLDPGFVVAVVEERSVRGGRWTRTLHGRWIAMTELVPFPVSRFHGEELKDGAPLDAAWVVSDVAAVYSGPSPTGRPAGKLARFERVAWHEERAASHGGSVMVRVSDDGVAPQRWVRARDLARAAVSAPPEEAGGASSTERWIDIDLAQQTLVAYEGARPVFATLVSTGRGGGGGQNDPTATPEGVHRISAKLTTNDMENLALESDDDASGDPFALEDVPYVQAIDRGVALFGAFWHGDFGRPRGRGNVGVAPKDAAWLFAFTAPHLLAGWSAVYPTPLEPGTVVRVRAGDAVTRDFPLDKARENVIHRPAGEAP